MFTVQRIARRAPMLASSAKWILILNKENESLDLLEKAPEEKLQAWLQEFYGKPVEILERETLRHRDLSFVERLSFNDSLPSSLIYKLVLPPWDVEQDLHERVLIPSISNSPQLFLRGQHGRLSALFLEDLGRNSLLANPTPELATKVGEELAKMHRAYSYRVDELMQMGILRSLLPLDYEEFTQQLCANLTEWNLIDAETEKALLRLSTTLAKKLAGEPTSLVHGDLYAENLIIRSERVFIIDWSWFTMLGVPLMDLATIAMKHHKNGGLFDLRDELLETYCFESGRKRAEVEELLPYAEHLSRLLFLHWLVERRSRGIMGTTVGPVDGLIPNIVQDLLVRLNLT